MLNTHLKENRITGSIPAIRSAKCGSKNYLIKAAVGNILHRVYDQHIDDGVEITA